MNKKHYIIIAILALAVAIGFGVYYGVKCGFQYAVDKAEQNLQQRGLETLAPVTEAKGTKVDASGLRRANPGEPVASYNAQRKDADFSTAELADLLDKYYDGKNDQATYVLSSGNYDDSGKIFRLSFVIFNGFKMLGEVSRATEIKSSITKGKLDFVVYDSASGMIQKIIRSNTTVTLNDLPDKGGFVLLAVGEKAQGDYQIAGSPGVLAAYKVKNSVDGK